MNYFSCYKTITQLRMYKGKHVLPTPISAKFYKKEYNELGNQTLLFK